MANVNADLQANAVANPPVRNKVNKQHGRIRWFEALYDQAVAGTASAADTITFGSLPVGARVIGALSEVNWSTGTASSTLALGDAADADRHLAATSIASASVAVPDDQSASGAQFETSDNSAAATNNCTIIGTVAGAATAAGQKIVVRIAYVCD